MPAGGGGSAISLPCQIPFRFLLTLPNTYIHAHFSGCPKQYFFLRAGPHPPREYPPTPGDLGTHYFGANSRVKNLQFQKKDNKDLLTTPGGGGPGRLTHPLPGVQRWGKNAWSLLQMSNIPLKNGIVTPFFEKIHFGRFWAT